MFNISTVPEGLLVVGGIYLFNNRTFVKPDTMLTACDSITLSVAVAAGIEWNYV